MLTTSATITIVGDYEKLMAFIGKTVTDDDLIISEYKLTPGAPGNGTVTTDPGDARRARSRAARRSGQRARRPRPLTVGNHVRVRAAGPHGADAGDTGVVTEIAHVGRGIRATVKWDDGTAPSHIIGSMLVRIRKPRAA